MRLPRRACCSKASLKLARDEDAGYLLAAAGNALRVHDCVDEAVVAIGQNRDLLAKGGRELFDTFADTGATCPDSRKKRSTSSKSRTYASAGS